MQRTCRSIWIAAELIPFAGTAWIRSYCVLFYEFHTLVDEVRELEGTAFSHICGAALELSILSEFDEQGLRVMASQK